MNSRELNFLANLIEAQRLTWPPEVRQLRSVGVFGDQDECWRLLAGVAGTGASPASAPWNCSDSDGSRGTMLRSTAGTKAAQTLRVQTIR